MIGNLYTEGTDTEKAQKHCKQLKLSKIQMNQLHKEPDPKTFEKKYTTPSHSRALATQLLTHMANSVLEQETRKQINYGKLRKHPRLQETWNKSFSN